MVISGPPSLRNVLFDLETWKAKVAVQLQDWRSRMKQAGAKSIYAFLSTASLWPVVEAARGGEWAALTALGGVVANVGGNLLANCLQSSALRLSLR
jgi:hypothetical protein